MTRQPSTREMDLAAAENDRQQAERARLEREAAERERMAELQWMYSQGEASSQMIRAADRVRWINDLVNGSWRTPADMAVPEYDRGEFKAAAEAARAAVLELIGPMLRDAEADLGAATKERDRIGRGGR